MKDSNEVGAITKLKDSDQVDGMKTFEDSDEVDEMMKTLEDQAEVAAMKMSGAILLCATNVSEVGIYLENSIDGTLNNPFRYGKKINK